MLYLLPDILDIPLFHLRVSLPETMKLIHMVLCFNRFKNVIFEIGPTEEVGDFEVKAKFMGVQMETFMLHYQDLLQLQYEGVAVMKLFDRAKVNVNLLIFLLNKKFYGK